MLLEQEDDVVGFLGLRLTKNYAGLVEMKKVGLIDRVIETLGLGSCISTPKWTPAEGTLLARDQDGEPPYDNFRYSSVVGMILYLSGHTQPDIAYAMNCCARYIFNPRHLHEIALK